MAPSPSGLPRSGSKHAPSGGPRRDGEALLYGAPQQHPNNRVQLASSDLPVQSTGHFIASMNTGSAIAFNSQGLLCLAQPIKRFAGPGQVLSSGASGAFTLALDLASFSSGPSVFGVQTGDIWKFQA